MFERYTQSARRVIFFSKYEASQLGSAEIEPEHLMLGLIRQDKATVEKLMLPDKDLDQFTATVKLIMTRNPPSDLGVEIPFSDTTKKVLLNSSHLADIFADQHIMVEHLLTSLLSELSPPIKNLWAEIQNPVLDPNEYQLVVDLAANFSEQLVLGENPKINEYTDKLPNNRCRLAFRRLANFSAFLRAIK